MGRGLDGSSRGKVRGVWTISLAKKTETERRWRSVPIREFFPELFNARIQCRQRRKGGSRVIVSLRTLLFSAALRQLESKNAPCETRFLDQGAGELECKGQKRVNDPNHPLCGRPVLLPKGKCDAWRPSLSRTTTRSA